MTGEDASARSAEDSGVKVFLHTFATVLTGVANALETADR
jgi:hypothetical protein